MTEKSKTIIVAENGQGRYQQTISAGKHTLIADEAPNLGGDDAGPAPFDLLCAALGACTSITLRMYAERKAWPLKAVSVEVQHHKEITAGGTITVFERAISLSGEIDPEQRQRLFEIAGKCPVHRALEGTVSIRSTLA